jgi:hypothetical protein
VRWNIRTLMIVVALLAVALATPNPLMSALLIFGCPLWIPVLVARSRARARASSAEGPWSACVGG